MHDYLSDLEVVKIETFCADKELFEAVRKVLLQHIYSHGVLKAGQAHDPYKNRAFALVSDNVTNEELGMNVKSWFEGVNALEQGFDALDKVRTEKAEGLLKTNVNIAE